MILFVRGPFSGADRSDSTAAYSPTDIALRGFHDDDHHDDDDGSDDKTMTRVFRSKF